MSEWRRSSVWLLLAGLTGVCFLALFAVNVFGRRDAHVVPPQAIPAAAEEEARAPSRSDVQKVRTETERPPPQIEDLEPPSPVADLPEIARVSAIRALGKQKGNDAAREVALFLKDPSVKVAAAAAEELGDIGSKEAVPALIEAIESKSAEIRKEAARALGKLKDERAVEPLLVLLDDADENVRNSTSRSLGDLNEFAFEALLKELSHASPIRRAIAALSFCTSKDRRAVDALMPLLDDDDWRARRGAAVALGCIGDGRAFEPMVKALRHPMTFGWVAEGIARLSPDRAIEVFVDILKNEKDGKKKESALAFLSRPPAESFDAVSLGLKDADPEVRKEAVHYLLVMTQRKRPPEGAIGLLVPHLEDPLPDVRAGLATVLKRTRDPAALEPVLKLLEDKSHQVRSSAAHGLTTLARGLALKGDKRGKLTELGEACRAFGRASRNERHAELRTLTEEIRSWFKRERAARE